MTVDQVVSAVFSTIAAARQAWSGPSVWVFFAQAPGAAGRQPTLPEIVLQYAPLLFVVLFAWLLLYRPERQRQLDAQRLRESIKKNDRVVTSAGIYGIVAAVDRENDRVTLKIDESSNVKMDVTLASVSRVFGGQSDAAAGGQSPSNAGTNRA